MKRIVVTYAYNDKSRPGVPLYGMNVIKMEGLTKCDQWNYMMDAITQANQDAIPSSICILYTKELLEL